MNLRVKAILVVLLGAVAAALAPSSALAYQSAPLNFCNNTSGLAAVAVGYKSPGVNDPADHSLLTGPYVSRGWFQIAAGTCQSLDNPFGARYMFWYAWSKGYNDKEFDVVSDNKFDGLNAFCISDYFAADISGSVPDFTFEEENVSIRECGAGLHHSPETLWITPHMVDTWVNPSVTFTAN
jgi:uncharacterized membrane protein